MKEQLKKIKEEALSALSFVKSETALEELRVKYLGKKGELTALLRQMGGLSAEERPVIGQLVNEIKGTIEAQIEKHGQALAAAALAANLEKESIDVTLPGKEPKRGGLHPITLTRQEVEQIFIGMGFGIEDGPEVETGYYNFEALNIPKNHPARDTQDTFYVNDDTVLRTATSPMQVRVMERQQPPIRIVSIGKVYRSDAIDATHSPMFHQIEGLVVDKGITLANLKGTLEVFAKRLYGEDIITRFRPHYFPFTEPSAEMDIQCFACKGEGCRVCKGEGWIEILGSGMVHPKVLSGCGIDPEVYSGFAFGMGLDRIVMKKYNIDDLRLLFENDIRFLKQFS